MKKMIENREVFHSEIEKLTLPELEVRIKERYKEFQRSYERKNEKLNACLSLRKRLINNNYNFTPEAVMRIERVNRILIEGMEKVLKPCAILYRQMLQIKKQGEDFLDDFEIEATVTVRFNNEDSVLTLDEDENNGQSDYVSMAEILEDTQTDFECLTSLLLNRRCRSTGKRRRAGIIDRSLKKNFKYKLLDVPELLFYSIKIKGIFAFIMTFVLIKKITINKQSL